MGVFDFTAPAGHYDPTRDKRAKKLESSIYHRRKPDEVGVAENKSFGLYDATDEKSACGVGFLTRKDSVQLHEPLALAHEALCAVPHRGGMSSEGVGDGAGISLDLSQSFFSQITGIKLKVGQFGVGNFFLPLKTDQRSRAISLVEQKLKFAGFSILASRDIPIDDTQIVERAKKWQLPIQQWIFIPGNKMPETSFERAIHRALLDIESVCYTDPELEGLYPLSLSSRLQVLKGRLNSWEIMPFFTDLQDESHCIHTLYFHTRFSTNTDPHPTMAQPFRLMAHNGELNTDKKNRLSEAAIALARNKSIIRPKGQSDSCRLDQTLSSRVFDEGLDLVDAVVSMMPPAWENQKNMNPNVRSMLEYFSLFEEKNDGPAALIFGDGRVVGARLDRLGLRPLRTVETKDYLAVMSEAGQINFTPSQIISRGRVEAGGMIYYDHLEKKTFRTADALSRLALKANYAEMVSQLSIELETLPSPAEEPALAASSYSGDLNLPARYVGYTHNQESFKFLMDPMLHLGLEKVSAMGYGNAINVLSVAEGGIAKYFSQRFAQVTNPPLDSIRELDGMTLRVALGEKPHVGRSRSRQIIIKSPILKMSEMLKISEQKYAPVRTFNLLYEPAKGDKKLNQEKLIEAIDSVAESVAIFARERGGIAILSDRSMDSRSASMPLILAISAINQKLIEEGVRLKLSLVVESGQIASSHHVACALGFGASAVYPLAVRLRAEEIYGFENATPALQKFIKAGEKALLKTMGKVGLCTVESYIGGEFFEPNFLDTNDSVLAKYFPNMRTPVGGVGFASIAESARDWHFHALTVKKSDQIPILGLFKERTEGAGHSYGMAAVRGFVDLTEEQISFGDKPERTTVDGEFIDGELDPLRLMTLRQINDAFEITEESYINTSFEKLSTTQINEFQITSGYRAFARNMAEERLRRPAALRDILALPADITHLTTAEDIKREMMLFNRAGNSDFVIRGLDCKQTGQNTLNLTLTGSSCGDAKRLNSLAQTLRERFGTDILELKIEKNEIKVKAIGQALDYLTRLKPAPHSISVSEVQPASEITRRFTSGAMSHGALVATAHEAVAHGTNMVGGLSNSGEGGEHISRYGTLRASRIKQFASGRFGVWAGYLADPKLEEIEIKIGQGAKPGEGGQLPAKKVTVEIAAARCGTPGVELISPPPHHDTYSIEDLGQLIHDAKAARVRVIVKLVSSEGIGTIAVGVAKAGADVINVAGNTGGTAAAAVTSLKYTGRAAEIGIAEVHQALSANGIRQKVQLRGSGAMQTGSDVVKASLLGADSFEFGTTALMMLKCVMAKNCNVKCPAGLTTNAETFDGDPRALAQYLLNVTHEVREILASLGFRSLGESRGRSDLLHLLDHPDSVGSLKLQEMLKKIDGPKVVNPVYRERDYAVDDVFLEQVKKFFKESGRSQLTLRPANNLNNCNKSVGGQLSIDLERLLNYELTEIPKVVFTDHRGRRYLDRGCIRIKSKGSAGQSYAAFCNDGLVFEHIGTCNDGVGKSSCGGEIIVKSPAGGGAGYGENVLVGNFTLFGATGGRVFIEGQAGDRFAVRNSGAIAVVEGVGEFCGEYMTNGSVLNIGGFSKGFGNGMSGGFLYQYDPEGKLQDAVSHDSVILGCVGDNGEGYQIHGDAVGQLLTWHHEATNSCRAAKMLENLEQTLKDITWVMPRALLQYQDADEILSSKNRKELIEELSVALVGYQIAEVKKAWKDKDPVLGGVIPPIGDEGKTPEMFRLLNSYTVLEMAQNLIEKRLPATTEPRSLDRMVRNLVVSEDFSLMAALAKHAKTALSDYSDIEIATLIANKRLTDFKEALSLRNPISMDSTGTYSWIIFQNEKNRAKIGTIPSFDELFANVSVADFVNRMPTETTFESATHTE